MQRAIGKLQITPEFIIVDGNRFKPYGDIPYKTIVKGDSKYMQTYYRKILERTGVENETTVPG